MTAAQDDERFMDEALTEAAAAGAADDVPVGCVITAQGAVIGRGHNRRERDGDPTAHAEMIALREAARAVGGWRLLGTTLYVTQEPCPMCAGAIVNARVERVVYGCDNPKAGAARTLYRILDDARLNHRAEVVAGVRTAESAQLLKDFFANKRRPK